MPRQSRTRLFFRRGLGALLPTLLTIIVLVACYNFLDEKISAPINRRIHSLLISSESGRRMVLDRWKIDVEKKQYQRPEQLGTMAWTPLVDSDGNLDDEKLHRLLQDRIPPIIGFMLALGFIFLLGFLVATYAGKRVFSSFELFLSNLPIVKVIYPYAKQFVEFVFKEKSALQFNSVVAVPFPHKDTYQIAFLTGGGLLKIDETTGQRHVNVFVPSSPTPFTGWAVFVPEDQIIPLPLTVDEAVRFLVTGGVIMPSSQVAGPIRLTPASLSLENTSSVMSQEGQTHRHSKGPP